MIFAPTALDASFLGVMDDGSGHNHELTLIGDACADDGGSVFGIIMPGDPADDGGAGVGGASQTSFAAASPPPLRATCRCPSKSFWPAS